MQNVTKTPIRVFLLSWCISCWKQNYLFIFLVELSLFHSWYDLKASVFPCWFLLDKLCYHFVSRFCLHSDQMTPRGKLFVETALEVPPCLLKWFLASHGVGLVTFSAVHKTQGWDILFIKQREAGGGTSKCCLEQAVSRRPWTELEKTRTKEFYILSCVTCFSKTTPVYFNNEHVLSVFRSEIKYSSTSCPCPLSI